jgi:hypothetical protein
VLRDGRPAREVEKLTAICEPFVYIRETLDISEHHRPPGPVTGIALPYFLLYAEFSRAISSNSLQLLKLIFLIYLRVWSVTKSTITAAIYRFIIPVRDDRWR